MPLSRFRIWTLMIAMAVVGLLGALLARPIEFERRGRYHQFKCAEAFHDLESLAEQSGMLIHDTNGFQRLDSAWFANDVEAQRLARRTNFHARLRDTYQNAARRPWLLVPLDPPEPK